MTSQTFQSSKLATFVMSLMVLNILLFFFFLADLNISVDCSFDHGVCDWKQDREDDFDWNPAGRDNGI